MNVAYTANQVTVYMPEGFEEMATRMRNLAMVKDEDRDGAWVVMMEQLADEFEQIDCVFNAEKCRQRAAQYRGAK